MARQPAGDHQAFTQSSIIGRLFGDEIAAACPLPLVSDVSDDGITALRAYLPIAAMIARRPRQLYRSMVLARLVLK